MWHFYDVETGELVGKSYSGPKDALAINTPEGCASVFSLAPVSGMHVDLPTGILVKVAGADEPDNVEVSANAARRRRDSLLAACDWVVARASEEGAPVPAAWRDYRKALRDLPKQSGFPDAVVWPTPPSA